MHNSLSIWTKNLVKKFGDFVSVDNVSLEVKTGEIFGFIGANGAGKTTTIRMLCGILAPTSGEGKVNGYDIIDEPEKIKSTIGYMSQKFSLYNDLTVEENIDFFCGAYKLNNQKARLAKKRAFEISGLYDVKHTLTCDLPVGWKQKLAFAIAFLHDPQLVFLDEPTAGVDPISRREFWDLIYKVSSEGVTCFVTTHYLDETEYCTNIAFINNGKIVVQDSPTNLKNHYQYDLFEVMSSDILKLFDILAGEFWVREISIFGATLHISIDKYTFNETGLAKEIESKGIKVNSITKISPSIEDVFVNLIKKQG